MRLPRPPRPSSLGSGKARRRSPKPCGRASRIRRISCSTYRTTRAGWLVRNVAGVQTDLHGRVDVAARALADHPAVGLHDFVLVHQPAIGLRIFFGHDLDELEQALQPGALDLGGLLRGLALGEENQPMALG